MAAPKTLKTLSGTKRSAGTVPAEPMNQEQLAAAIEQLQATMNELIVRFNAHTHGGVTAGAGSSAVPTGQVTGAGAAAADLFTA